MPRILPPGWMEDDDKASAWQPGQTIAAYFENRKCPNGCEDNRMYGWQIQASGRGHWFGKIYRPAQLVVAWCPVCSGEARPEWLRLNSGLSGKFLEGKPMLDLEMPSPAVGQHEAVQAAEACLAELPKPHTWFLLHGGYGCGKTHILAAMVNFTIRANFSAEYTTSHDILGRIKASFYPETSKETSASVVQHIETIPVLVIDEVNRVKWTEWAGEQLFAILEHRHNAGLATWMASNATPETLEQSSGPMAALVSRASAGRIVAITTPDLRPAMAAQESWIDR